MTLSPAATSSYWTFCQLPRLRRPRSRQKTDHNPENGQHYGGNRASRPDPFTGMGQPESQLESGTMDFWYSQRDCRPIGVIARHITDLGGQKGTMSPLSFHGLDAGGGLINVIGSILNSAPARRSAFMGQTFRAQSDTDVQIQGSQDALAAQASASSSDAPSRIGLRIRLNISPEVPENSSLSNHFERILWDTYCPDTPRWQIHRLQTYCLSEESKLEQLQAAVTLLMARLISIASLSASAIPSPEHTHE
ncbi:hypothetical protein PG997_010237 [Apiospora hydei]|uniref:Uncharacterized protein n=1 Tax=Apiospora hydei TaxID=1337664 RepID=A0ABR1W067_9PEZI